MKNNLTYTRCGDYYKPLPENFHSCYQRLKQGEITGTAAEKECEIPLATFRYKRKFTKMPGYCKCVCFTGRSTFLQPRFSLCAGRITANIYNSRVEKCTAVV